MQEKSPKNSEGDEEDEPNGYDYLDDSLNLAAKSPK
jgi:hypothetical protein